MWANKKLYLIRLLLVCYDLTGYLHKKILGAMLKLRFDKTSKGADMRLRTKH